jgi:glucokinase
MILAGDIGGTHTRLAFFDVANTRLTLSSARVFPSHQYAGLDQIVAEFIKGSSVRPDRACFGVAGPVRNGRVETSNLPWIVESKRLANELEIAKVSLINDLEAHAWGIAELDPKDAITLNQGNEIPGNQAVIAAGTGLGEAGTYWDGTQHHVFASEGGHTDFAPRNELEIELLRHLTDKFGRVSYERILSGPGLVNVFNFLRDTGRGSAPQWLSEQMQSSDPAAAISQAAMNGSCPLCEQAIDIFVSVYAAEAGNLVLKIMATGGVFLAGGIAPKLLSKLSQPSFMLAFATKGRMQPMLQSVPVKVITNDKIPLFGAARCALVKSAN